MFLLGTHSPNFLELQAAKRTDRLTQGEMYINSTGLVTTGQHIVRLG